MSEHFHIGQAVRDLRRQRNLTGEELAKKAGLSQSKISRIETGASAGLKPDEIEKILHILDASQTIQQQAMTTLGQLKATHLQRYKAQYPLKDTYEQERQASLIRVFAINHVPALLQTIPYRQALLARRELPYGDDERYMTTVAKRQDMLWDKQRRYHFILHETALYTALANPATQVGQLDRVERFVGVNNIKLGIIPTVAGLTAMESGTFVVHDENYLAKIIANGDIISREADDIAAHLKVFAELDKLADYGDSAHALIRKAMDYFS